MYNGGNGGGCDPPLFLPIFSRGFYISTCRFHWLFVHPLDIFLKMFKFFGAFFFIIMVSVFIYFYFFQTNFAFQFPHKKVSTRTLRIRSDETVLLRSAGLFIFDLLCVRPCHFDFGSQTMSLN